MISALMLAAAMSGNPNDLLNDAIGRYRQLHGYQVSMDSYHAHGEEHLRYSYRRPGFVRMEFIRPHTGAVLIYSPVTQRVRLWPFGVGRFPELTLSPDNRLIKSPRGQRVDRSDIGTLFENVLALQQRGKMQLLGETSVDGMPALHLAVSGQDEATVGDIQRYELWLDAETLFPRQIISRDRAGQVLETVHLRDIQLNPKLPPQLFEPTD